MRKTVDESIGDIGLRIKTARCAAGLTQEALAKSIGASSQYLSDLERGKVGTSINTLIKICTLLDTSADYILFGKTSMDAAIESISGRLSRMEGKLEVIGNIIADGSNQTV